MPTDCLRRVPRSTTLLAFVLSVLALALSCADGESSGDTSFWDSLRTTGSEVESYDSLPEMADASGLVVRGSFVDFRFSRMLGDSISGGAVVYGIADLLVTDVLRGPGDLTSLPVEFIVGVRLDQDPVDAVAERARSLPEGEVIAFLRDKGSEPGHIPGDIGKYRLVNSTGLWAMVGDRLSSVLSEAEWDRQKPYAAELAGIESLDQLAEQIGR